MSGLQKLSNTYGSTDCRDLGSRQLEVLRDGLKQVAADEIESAEAGKLFIELLRKFREAVAENDKLHGENYPQLLNSLLSVGEDGLYSNSLRFIFELIQNVDDCEFRNLGDCKLDMRFDFNRGEIVLTYNEVGFTPFNVFAITGIAEAAKNVSASKNEIGEKGIGFKSVFGVAERVLIRSGWFSFELYKENFTIPVAAYKNSQFCPGTEMTLYVPGKALDIYRQIRDQYCRKEALFGKNPLLFLNKLTSLKLYNDDAWRSMEFSVTRTPIPATRGIHREENVRIAVNLRDHDNGIDKETVEEISCCRYTYPVVYSQEACQSRYGENTQVGSKGGKPMFLQAVLPYPAEVSIVGKGGLYSFLPTQLGFSVPVVCHAPFKLDASREFVDPQDNETPGGNQWFRETSSFLSKLMDYVFSDWATVVRQDIVYYLPSLSASLFARNNGKEKCLSGQEYFMGSHYLELPLFYSVDGTYMQAADVFYFDPSEKIHEPEKVAQMLGTSKKLFLFPEGVVNSDFGITVEQNVYNRLFRRALSVPQQTREILEYLDMVGYEYSEKQFPKDKEYGLTPEQIEIIMENKHLSEIILRIANEAIQGNQRPGFFIDSKALVPVTDVLDEGFEINETPGKVANYLNRCGGYCICLDVPKNSYLPCHNAIALSNTDPLTSFAAFCYEMDQGDTFAIRVRLREASRQLDEWIENNTGTAVEYLRTLKNIRMAVKESLGKTGYKNYLELILKSGTDRNRFIQELLQNADDCVYPEGSIPTFKLTQQDGCIITEYNEVGFTRENIRSITAIGESTKNRLLKGDLHSIGEKGVGFKTVFATASEVKIHSGDYHFALTLEAPTIPRLLSGTQETVNGTRMEITLRDQTAAPSLKPADILELCLCLRQLRKLEINGHKVSISDSDTQRTVKIDSHAYIYSKYVHCFLVTDKEAIRERENRTRTIDPEQQITCYVPEKTSATDFPLYNGLPTKHRIKVPMVIDAPFELTTSREEIEVDCASWNDIVKQETYDAVVEVILARKNEERANVLRFAKFVYRMLGNQASSYVNDLFDLPYLNSYDYLSRLRSEEILPTFDRKLFTSVDRKTAYRFPDAAVLLLRKLRVSDYGDLQPGTVIDTELEGMNKEQKERIDAVFNALACDTAPFSMVFPLLQAHSESFISKEEVFRNQLYEYLQKTPIEFQEQLKELNIIPVYGKTAGTKYVSWIDDGIFVRKDVHTSGDFYWVLNETLLPKTMCETMLGVNINEMNDEWEHNRYRNNLREILKGDDVDGIYKYLIREYSNGNLKKNDCYGVLLELKRYIPLKNEKGEITDTELFLCDQPAGYFSVEMLQRIIVHEECSGFAEFINCAKLSDIHYENLDYCEELTADDVEALQDDYFVHSKELLRGFYEKDLLSDELLEKYDLQFLSVADMSEDEYQFDFPEEQMGDPQALKAHVQKLFNNPVKMVNVKVERTVQKCQNSNGEIFDPGTGEIRTGMLTKYTPEGGQKQCFCQMCRRVKPYGFIEVNNVELNPKLYFPQMRIGLCLECSKRYELMRNNLLIREEFLEELRNSIISGLGKTEIPIGGEYTITFTDKHLAEIQEILNKRSEEI